ncbi:odorant receptor 33a-like [Hermetia illucens]|nr:odorant receptor 33a-like [Hermetia illucens]
MVDSVFCRKVKTVRFLDKLWYFARIHGYFASQNYNFWQIIIVAYVILVPNFVTIISFEFQLPFIRDMEQLSENFYMNMSVLTCCSKFLIILKMRPKLISINDLFGKLDNVGLTAQQSDKLQKEILNCNRLTTFVTFWYWLVSTTTAFNASLSNGKILMFNVWTPYDFQQSPWVYWITLLFQYSCFIIVATQNMTNDLIGPLYFIMLRAHLQILIERIQNIGWDPMKTQDENYEDLVNSIKDHKIIMNIYNILQNLISLTIFIQFADTAIVTAMQLLIILFYAVNFSQIIMLMVSSLASIIEILICCYFADSFTEVTNNLVNAIYSANIFDQSRNFQRTAIIFMQMTQESKVVLAGKVLPITLVTFASIMKTSYSLLTLANHMR